MPQEQRFRTGRRPPYDGSRVGHPVRGRPGGHPLYRTYSLIFATFLGTMGLPHVLVRFYTNPDGRAARRTTLVVIGLLGAFYVFPAVFGALGRLYAPQLLLTGQTDAVVLLLPGSAIGGAAGAVLGAVLAAGAFAAFLSTSSGLVVSVAGVVGHDLLGGTIRSFRQGTLVAGAVPLLLSFFAANLPVSEVVAMAFAVAASSFCPLLLLGIWWRGLTDIGAMAGLVLEAGRGLRRLAAHRRLRAAGLALGPARAACGGDGAARVRHDDRRLPGDPPAPAGRPDAGHDAHALTRGARHRLTE